MKIREAAEKTAELARSNRTLARMIAAFVVGFILGAVVL